MRHSGLSYSVFIHISPCLILKIFHFISGGPLKRQIVQPQYIIRKQCFKMKWRTLSWEYVKSGGKFHHRRKLCQVLTPPPTARKLNFPPWQFLSCSLPPPHSYLGQLSLRAKKIPTTRFGSSSKSWLGEVSADV